MSQSLQLHILENSQSTYSADLSAPLEIGRQDKRKKDPGPYTLCDSSEPGMQRLILASTHENNVGRQHVTLVPLPSGMVEVKNGSQIPLPHDDLSQPAIPPGESLQLSPPFSLSIPPRTITVSHESEDGLQSLGGNTIGPGNLSSLSRQWQQMPTVGPGQLGELVGWLRTTMGVLQSSVGSADFQQRAAEALVQIVGLSSGRVLVREGEEWREVAVSSGGPCVPGWSASRRVLKHMMVQRTTVWEMPRQSKEASTQSLDGVETVVAAPLLDAGGEIIGALYGEQCLGVGSSAKHISKLEALLVDLLACGVATGLARQQEEEMRQRFEQFFPKDLAERLQKEPGLLEGREAKVTMLFCDVRGFSTISENLRDPAMVMQWMNDVMNELSECVMDQRGVLVDYVGDELFAMWGAPAVQEDQVARAVRAGLSMLERLEILDERWESTVGGKLGIGIGINTGTVHVGNTGSKLKFKYGPLGDAVNLASRVQGLTKYLRCPLLVTESTKHDLPSDFITRRVCEALVVGKKQSVQLFSVEPASPPEREQFLRESESALEDLEKKNFVEAARKAGALLAEHRGDGPLLLTLSRATRMLVELDEDFDPVWIPPGK